MDLILTQSPAPGTRRAACCGDVAEFTLTLSRPARGRACVRTNIGHAATARGEIVREAAARQKRLAEDWFDVPMTQENERRFRLVLPLIESGHFEAKALFLPEKDGQPRWPEGPNAVINVHPAESCCAAGIYNAFVRQFGQARRPMPALTPPQAEAHRAFEAAGYTMIPPSGTFRDLIRELDFIVGRLRCRTLLLLPIHPTPTVYGRMGAFGSPYAALDFMDVDPALADFDPKATPLEQFGELVDAVHARGARLFLDIAINHTGWAAKLHGEHPDWLVREPDGTIRSPGAWGVVWRDLAELNHQLVPLWHYLAEVFRTWCRRGADGFRCDAGYMIPVPAWEFIIATVRREFPDTVFLLEGLGGKLETTEALLSTSNLNWAYSELFQNYDRRQLEGYLPGAFRLSREAGLLVHFAETHDNNRLAARSIPYARMRTALAALCSSNGAFAFANGAEWHAAEKIAVHGRASLAWGNPENQVDRIARLNALLQTHPAFAEGAGVRLIQQGAGNSLALLRRAAVPSEARLLVLVNLDDAAPQTVAWPAAETGPAAAPWTDLLSGRTVAVEGGPDGLARLTLAPADVFCLAPERTAYERLLAAEHAPCREPPGRVLRQRLRAKALEVAVACRGAGGLGALEPESLADELASDPFALCRRLDPPDAAPRVTAWDWPRDTRRAVMVPPCHFLCLRAAVPFRARLEPEPPDDNRQGEPAFLGRQEDSLPSADGRHFVLFAPVPVPAAPRAVHLRLDLYEAGAARHGGGPLLFLPPGEAARVPLDFPHRVLRSTSPVLLSTNGRGGMARARVAWGDLQSRYDALLAGNLNTDHPEDRRIMLTRCRAWLVYRGYSQDITLDRLTVFRLLPNGGLWRFRVPFGYGQLVFLEIRLEMTPGRNAVRLEFRRLPCAAAEHDLADDRTVRLIIRPDIEDRSFHEDTKAYLGPERDWPAAVRPEPAGFSFAPDPARRLHVCLSAGRFQPEPEWHYNVHHPVEAERGMQPDSDLFSPGFFSCPLDGGQEAVLLAQILTPAESNPLALPGRAGRSAGARARRQDGRAAGEPPGPAADSAVEPGSMPLGDALARALRAFIARRGAHQTVIAGYPWFLDWGRDTFICARGLVAAGALDDVAAILKAFAAFEQDGTLPNVIFGNDARNRDTSDAPLWFITACAEHGRAAQSHALLSERCGSRTLKQVLRSLAEGIIRGTPNGIRMDPDSGLVFSPSHFTWMDTNFPAATPREGFPIELQALWSAALDFLAALEPMGSWRVLADRARDSIRRLFWDERRGYYADCLRARPGQRADQAAPDDALRPNQLLVLTLGAESDPARGARVLEACGELLVPGAIRSLADRPVESPLPVYLGSRLLNDPVRPYWGRYDGPEDERRKPAYHNGTAWTWLYPSYAEAWVRVHGPAGRGTARAWLGAAAALMAGGCLGQVPELLDGDFPHTPRGCDAQAWGVTELFRVWTLLGGDTTPGNFSLASPQPFP